MRLAALAAILMVPLAVPADAALAPGVKAPLFVTQGAIAGKEITVDLAKQLKQGPVVLYFFPAAFTSGCNAEATAFAQNIAAFKAAGATVIGMSSDDVGELKKFSSAHCAGKFAVATASPTVAVGYDVQLAEKHKGRKITDRVSYVIAPDGNITYAYADSSAAAHIRNTLAEVRKLKAKPH